MKRLSTRFKIELLAALSCTRAEFERDDSEALQNAASCRVLLHSLVAKVRRSLPNTTGLEVGIDGDIAVVEPGETVEAGAKQASESGTETGGTKDQY